MAQLIADDFLGTTWRCQRSVWAHVAVLVKSWEPRRRALWPMSVAYSPLSFPASILRFGVGIGRRRRRVASACWPGMHQQPPRAPWLSQILACSNKSIAGHMQAVRGRMAQSGFRTALFSHGRIMSSSRDGIVCCRLSTAILPRSEVNDDLDKRDSVEPSRTTCFAARILSQAARSIITMAFCVSLARPLWIKSTKPSSILHLGEDSEHLCTGSSIEKAPHYNT
ncbi:hypothetical protein LZ31DRAFT_25575 [Colletotrichum somersetense]|nr:hypothetical protein LZ31DRAFT_25575 [Colletotrichum somersetense]